MGRLDTLLALNSAHEASGWRHVDARDVVRALTKACGVSAGFGLPREVRGSVLLRALVSCKLIPGDAPRAVLASALCFTLAHLTTGPPVLALAAALAGGAWTMLAIRSRSLFAPFIAHLGWDVTMLWLLPMAGSA